MSPHEPFGGVVGLKERNHHPSACMTATSTRTPPVQPTGPYDPPPGPARPHLRRTGLRVRGVRSLRFLRIRMDIFRDPSHRCVCPLAPNDRLRAPSSPLTQLL